MTDELKILQRNQPLFHRGRIAIPVPDSAKTLFNDNRWFFTQYQVVAAPGGEEGNIIVGINPHSKITLCFIACSHKTAIMCNSLSAAIDHMNGLAPQYLQSATVDESLSIPALATYVRLAFEAGDISQVRSYRYIRSWDVYESAFPCPESYFFRTNLLRYHAAEDVNIGFIGQLKEFEGYLACYRSAASSINLPFPSFEKAVGWLWCCHNYATIRRRRRFEDHAHEAFDAILSGVPANSSRMCDMLCGFRFNTEFPFTLHTFEQSELKECIGFNNGHELLVAARSCWMPGRNHWRVGMSNQGRVIYCQGGGTGQTGPMSRKKVHSLELSVA